MACAFLLGNPAYAALPGVHISQVGCTGAQPRNSCYTYLGGNYLEVGIAPNGSHGKANTGGGGATLATINANKVSGNDFAGRQGTGNDGIGLVGDADGFGNGADLRVDYFLPGSPTEGWGIYVGTTSAGINSNSSSTIPLTSATNTSAGDTLSWTGVHTTNTGTTGIEVTQVISFDKNGRQPTYSVTLKNTTASTISDMMYYRFVDPDNTVDVDAGFSAYSTTNTIVSQGDGTAGSLASVKAESPASGTYYTRAGNQVSVVGYASSDSRAKVFHNLSSVTRAILNAPPATNATVTSDRRIGIAFTVSSLAAGASTTFSYKVGLGEAPTVGLSVSSIAPAASPAAADAAMDFTATFSEAVNGVDAADFTLTKTGTADGTIGAPSTGDGGITWTVPITGITGSGTLRLDLNNTGTGITTVATAAAIGTGFSTGTAHTVDRVAPTTMSFPTAITPSTSGLPFKVRINEAGTGYWMIVPNGSTAPTAAEIEGGVNYGAVTIKAAGNSALSANTTASLTAAGALTAGQSYDLYFVAKDTAGNRQADGAISSVTSITFPTLTYSGLSFTEHSSSNGTISGTATLTLSGGETFNASVADELVAASKVTVTNLPAGLTASDKSVDVSNLTLAFGNTAFTGASAAAVSGATTSTLAVDFNPAIAYSATTFAEQADRRGDQ